MPPLTLTAAVNDERNFDVKIKDTRRLEVSAVLLLDVAGVSFIRNDPWPMVKVLLAIFNVEKLDALGDRSRAVRNWYMAAAGLLEGGRDFKTLRAQLADARRLFPGDAGLLMASGSGLETEGKNLDDAVAFYRASLAIDGANAECRIRLARVLLRTGDAAASLAELDRMPRPVDERLAYLRELFRAAAMAALKRTSDAERQFVRTLEWNAQAPYLGLAESMAARGDEAGARQLIAKLLAANVDEEPWAAYVKGQWRHYPILLDEARRALKGKRSCSC
jgi:tetratricopeptide (TPR) repeat protein